jgi:NADH-quinone oxidoreductase subunit L
MESLFAIQYSYLIPLLPLLGAAVAGLLGAKWLKGQSHWPIWLGVGASAVLSFSLLFGMMGRFEQHVPITPEGGVWPFKQLNESLRQVAASVDWYTWIEAGSFQASAGFFIDALTAVMLCVVTGVGFFITVFSKGYMAGEKGYFRFFAYLGLFIFMMTILVMGDNFLMLYLGWEGVGLCSYLLIGYYYEKPSAREAAKKAFLVNRIGDFGFGVGIMLIFMAFGTVSYFGNVDQPGVLIQASKIAVGTGLTPFQQQAMQWIPFLLMLGAFGKSAQFPLYVWLPDAMEGPTPVSALIHAATMVTAGVYMIARCGALFVGNAAAMWTVAAVGAFTAIFAATIALRQFDLKKVFAYSTISQLGFMFVGVGVLAPVAGLFHLVTHAFFKALLFLSSGVVMHAMAGELDMRKMSGLKRVLPLTRWFMLAGCLALAGVIPFSGFWSKDEIVIAAFERSVVIGMVMLVTALLTAYYTFRLYFRVFEGPLVVPEAPAHGHGHHNHEPLSMMLPLAVLTMGAIAGGVLNVPGHWLGHFLGHSPSLRMPFDMFSGAQVHVNPAMFGQKVDAEHAAPAWHMSVMAISVLMAFLGVGMAYLMHLKDRAKAERLAERFPGVVRVLEARYWVDEIYQAGIVEPLRQLGRVFVAIDNIAVDGIIWIVAFVPQLFGFGLKLTAQRGSLQGYALAMLMMLAVILLVVFW